MREVHHLRRRYRAILAYVGLISALIGALLFAPLLATPAWPIGVGELLAFAAPGLCLVFAGGLAWRMLGPGEQALTLQEGGVIVLLSWAVASVAGALPLMAIGGLDLTQACFESVSGWTTTGLSVLDVTTTSPCILLWRSTMQLAGGAGLAILMLAAIAGSGGAPLAVAEGRGENLVPNVRASSALVTKLYVGFVLFGIVALRTAGMEWFDAINHSFCALSTGGFSTRAQSIGFWDSPAIEAVTIGLMLLGGMSFLTSWCLLRGRFAAVRQNGELRVIVLLVPLVTLLLLFGPAMPVAQFAEIDAKAVRVALFETISALTTTGYSTVSYTHWTSFGVLLLILLMLVGSGTCSTGGAIKQHRIYVLFGAVRAELRRPFRPRTTVAGDAIYFGETRVAIGDAQVRAIGVFVGLYVATWLIGSAALAAHGYPLQDCLFEFGSALGTVGLSIGITGPGTPGSVLWVQTIGMLLGRLEFFVIFVSSAKLVIDLRAMTRNAA